MAVDFSPTARAAQLAAARGGGSRPATDSAPPMVPNHQTAAETQWCEWPRREASKRPYTSIRQALLAIQARHA